ncbi:MAG: major facilitator superfamily 1 [Chloroflexi bacterium]|nr:major facilitator superfamily 1 [Chloroflexota bacterium]
MAIRSNESPVWQNGPFLRIWIAQAITQTAQNAIWYGLLVIVEEMSHSTTQLGITILSVILPSVLFGVPAGVYVDRWNKRTVLVVTNLLRCVVVAAFIPFHSTVVLLLTMSFVFSAITQFFAPAETAMIPAIVGRTRLMQANSFFTLTFTASQLLGLVLVGPLIVKMFGTTQLVGIVTMGPVIVELSGTTVFFMLMAALYGVSGLLVWRLPSDVVGRDEAKDVNPVAELFSQLREVRDMLLADRAMLSAMGYLTLGGALTLIVAMLAPRFAVDVLGIAPEDAVFIMAPAGVGMLAAATALSRATSGFLVDRNRVVTTGLVIVSLSLGIAAGLPAVLGMLRPEGIGVVVISEARLPWCTSRCLSWGDVALVGSVMLATLFAGLGFAGILVASQTLLQERAPVRARGRVFAIQLMVANLASIIPLLSVGGLSDFIGVGRVLLILAVLVMVAAYISRSHRADPRADPQPSQP